MVAGMLTLAIGGLGFVGGVAGVSPHVRVSSQPSVVQHADELEDDEEEVDDGELSLERAVRDDDVATLRQLLAEDVSAEQVTEQAFEALRYGSNDCLALLLATPVIDVNKVDDMGFSMLETALRAYNFTAARMLLQHDGLEQSKVSPLVLPLLQGDATELERLLQAGKLPRCCEGMPSLLHMAAAAGQADCLRVLLQQPWLSVNGIDAEERSVIYRAVDGGSAECVRLLMDCPEVRTGVWWWYRSCPIERAVEMGRPDLIEILLTGPEIVVHADFALTTAIESGQVECVRVLLAKGALEDCNTPDVGGDTPLLLAARHGRAEILRMLLQQPGQLLHVRSQDGRTALMEAVKGRHADCVSVLLQAGAQTGIDDRLPFSRDFILTPTVVRGLLPAGADWLQRRNAQGDTLLHLVARQGQAESLRYLLALPGCDVNVTDATGKSPLELAAEAGHTGCVALLVNHPGLDMQHALYVLNYVVVNVEDSALIGVFLQSPGVRRALANRSADYQALYSAAVLEVPAAFEPLLALVDDPSVLRDFEGRSLLAYAVRYGEPQHIERVHSRFPELVSVRDAYGSTLLHIAVTWDAPEQVRRLLQIDGVDINAVDDSGYRTPDCVLSDLYTDTKRKHVAEIVQMLSDAGVDVNAPGVHGRTLLGSAVVKGAQEVVEQLLSLPGIDVNRVDAHGYAPVHYAIMGNNEELIELLFKAPGLNLKQRDKWGRTPVQLMKEMDGSQSKAFIHSFAGEELIQKGNVDTLSVVLELDDDEAELYRLLGIAAEYGQLDCLKLLLQTPGVPLNVPSAVDGELSPLQLALPHPACVQALLAVQGIDVGYRNAGGFSALDIAAQLGHADSLQLLLSHPEVLRDFISRTPDISAIDKMYATPECRELLRAAYQQASPQSTPQVTEP